MTETMQEILPHIRLKYHLEHPGLDECWSDGYECAIHDLSEDENPYDEHTPEGEHWLQGWWAGFYGEERLFDINRLPEMAAYRKEVVSISDRDAANEEFQWNKSTALRFVTQIVKVSGLIAATVVAVEILEIVI